jgi:hypothetical protein
MQIGLPQIGNEQSVPFTEHETGLFCVEFEVLTAMMSVELNVFEDLTSSNMIGNYQRSYIEE